MKLSVSELRPNPYRNIKHYPIDDEKVEALIASIKSTTFWDNLLARKTPDGDGYEIAYGHHRLHALKKARISEIDIPVRKLDNTLMAKIMAHENMEEWGHKATIEQETVRSIIEAYGRGEIELPKPKTGQGSGSLRYAPKFVPRAQTSGDYPYTIETLCDFLGWKYYKVQAALSALELIDSEIVEADTFKDLSTKQARVVAEQANRILKERREPDPKKAAGIVARGLAAGMRKSVGRSRKGEKGKAGVTIHTAKYAADEMLGRHLRKQISDKPKDMPNIDRFVEQWVKAYGKFQDETDDKLAAIIKYREHLSAESHKMLVGTLKRTLKDTSDALAKLDSDALVMTIDAMEKGGALLRSRH